MAGIRVGKAHVAPDAPSHVQGVRSGNEGPYHEQPGHLGDGRATAERSTGINPAARNPIDPRMPNLTPP